MSSFKNPHQRWRPGHLQDHEWRKRRFLFMRFARFVVLALFIFIAGLVGLGYLFARIVSGTEPLTGWVWVAGSGIALATPAIIIFFGVRSFRSFANPIARVMAAADAVADGDLSARIPVVGRGEFRRLALSFNRMVSELEQSDQLRRNLTADVAHELRTPLHIIQGNLEGILDGVYQPDQAHIDLLLNETRQLSRLVEDLRTLSLAEAGQLALEKEAVNILELLEDTMTSFSGQAEVAGVKMTLENEIQQENVKIVGDAGRLSQVLSNLVANALRFTPAGGEIILRASENSENIELQVCDTGNGISPEDLDHIFDRFWSSGYPAGEKGRYGGSGLGLAIARQLVQAHGGHIAVASQIDKGTIFTIDLPIKVDQGEGQSLV